MTLTLKKYQPTQFIKAFPSEMQRMVERAFPTINAARNQKEVPLIEHVAMAHGDKITIGWIESQLVAVAKFAGAKNTLSDEQLLELAPQIRYNYGYLNLVEFILFCARLRSGKYEAFYGAVDPMAILKSLDTFCQDRHKEHAKAYQEELKRQEEQERIEHDKHLISFEDWYARLPEDQKTEYSKFLPIDFGKRLKDGTAFDWVGTQFNSLLRQNKLNSL